MADNVKQMKDLMYELLQEPSKEKFRNFIMNNTGEEDSVDFKSEWIERGKLSKLFLSLGNSGGGVIVFGIHENDDGTIEPVGLKRLEEPSKVHNMIDSLVPSKLVYEIFDFSFEGSEYQKLIGKKFQVVHVKDTPSFLPFLSLSETTGIEKGAIYIRRGTKCEKARGEEIEEILNRRIETQYSSSSILSLEDHLNQLNILYEAYEKFKISKARKSFFGPSAYVLQNLYTKGRFLFDIDDYESFYC